MYWEKAWQSFSLQILFRIITVQSYCIGCPKNHKSSVMGTIISIWLPLYLKSVKALFFGGHTFWHIQRKCRKSTKENMSSDHNCYNFLQEGPINSIPSLDCCHFIADSGNAHNDHFLTIWPFSHLVKTWTYGINKDISGNSYKNTAFWWRNKVDSTFLQEMRARMVRW